MAEADEKYCSNCKRNIASGNFLMHSVHCQRNIKLCTRCNEPVPHSEMEDHLNNFHSKMSCSKCGLFMEQWKLEEHEINLCPKRITSCHYCELECAQDKIEEHVSYCGSRTEICPSCRNYVMIKDRIEHEEKCKIKENRHRDIDDLQTDLPGNDNRKLHRRSWERNGRQIDAKNNGSKGNLPGKPNSNAGQINTTPEERQSFSDESVFHDGNTAHAPLNVSGNLDDLLALQLNSEEAGIDEFISEFAPWLPHSYFPQIPYQTIDDSIDEFIGPMKNVIDESKFNNDNVVNLPCEFCEELFPEEDLIQHQSGCELNIQVLPSDAKYPSSEGRSKVESKLPSPPPPNKHSPKHQPDPSLDVTDEVDRQQKKGRNNSISKNTYTPLPSCVGNKPSMKDSLLKPVGKISERPLKYRTSKALPNSGNRTSENLSSFSKPVKSDQSLYKKYPPVKDYSSERARKIPGRSFDESNRMFYQYLEEMKTINSYADDIKRKARSTGVNPKQDFSSFPPSTNSCSEFRSSHAAPKKNLETKSSWKPKSTYQNLLQQEDKSTRSRHEKSEVSQLELTARPMTLISRSKSNYNSKDECMLYIRRILLKFHCKDKN